MAQAPGRHFVPTGISSLPTDAARISNAQDTADLKGALSILAAKLAELQDIHDRASAALAPGSTASPAAIKTLVHTIKVRSA